MQDLREKWAAKLERLPEWQKPLLGFVVILVFIVALPIIGVVLIGMAGYYMVDSLLTD